MPYTTTIVLITAISGFFLTSSASASHQEDADLMSLSLEELSNIEVSSASLIGVTTQNTPSSVTFIDESNWLRDGSERLFDTLKMTPSTLVTPSISGSEIVMIRGYARTTSSRGVSMLWDGVPLGEFYRGTPTLYYSAINLTTLSSIELTRGPGSALHGSDAFHGVIALNSFNTQRSAPDAVSLRKGNLGHYEVGVRHTLFESSQQDVRIALANSGQPKQARDYESFYQPSANEELIFAGERDLTFDARTGVLSYRNELSSATVLETGYYFHRYEAQGWQGAGPTIAGNYDEGGQLSRFNMGKIAIEHEISDKSKLSLEGFYWDLDSDLMIGLNLSPVGQLSADGTIHAKQNRYGLKFTYQQQLNWLNTQWALSAGADRQGITQSSVTIRDLSGTALQSGSDPLDGRTNQINSLTYESQSQLNQDFTLHLGLRADRYSDLDTHYSPRVGLVFAYNNFHTLKATYSEAFRAPSATELYAQSSLALGNEELEPETLNNWEVSWLYHSKHQSAQMTIFHSRWRNGIVTVLDGVQPMYENAEKNQSTGLELSTAAQVAAWSFDGNASWVLSKNTNTDTYYDAFPRFMLNLTLGYDYTPLSTKLALMQQWKFDYMDVVIQNERLPGSELPNYSTTDISAIHRLGPRTNIILYVKNVFDRDNWLPAIATNGGNLESGRSFSIEFRHLH